MWSCNVSLSLIVVFITLSAAWIVSSTAFLQTTPLPFQVHLQKPNSIGHQHHQQQWHHYHHHHHHHLVTASKNANNNDSVFDMEELWQRIRTEQQKQRPSGQSQWRSQQQQQQQQQQQSSISSKPQIPLLDYVYIVTFPERSTTERTSALSSSSQHSSGGIHSIQYPSGKNVILAFTNQTSCDQFVQHLRQQQFFDPMTLKISIEALVEICLNVGVLMEVIPEGIDILPPTQHVPQFGLQQQQKSSSSLSSSSIDEYQQIQQLRDKFNFAYYMLDETDDLEEEGILFDDFTSWSFR